VQLSKSNLLLLASMLILTGCGTSPIKRSSHGGTSQGTRYYQDDGPIANVSMAQIDAIPEPRPVREPLHHGALKPYTALGKTYHPMTRLEPFHQRGMATWYGLKYHGKRNAIGEQYDALLLTAAHPTLPLPCYARVTNLENGKSIVVRVNDRGPFLYDRVIDLSYAAAMRLGLANKGSAMVDVDLIIP
jgi:rare lipoprotein A